MSTITIDAPIEVEAPAEVTPGDLLRRAADILEEFGWRQHQCGSRALGSMCAFGAVFEAAEDLGISWRDPFIRKAVGYELSSWNDEPGRTKAEVVAKLREFAAM